MIYITNIHIIKIYVKRYVQKSAMFKLSKNKAVHMWFHLTILFSICVIRRIGSDQRGNQNP
jgi:hypothetical protein